MGNDNERRENRAMTTISDNALFVIMMLSALIGYFARMMHETLKKWDLYDDYEEGQNYND